MSPRSSRRLVLLALALAPAPLLAHSPPAGDGVVRIEPPEAGFFAKRIDYRGIPIKAHADVADEALVEAKRRLGRMLDKIPAAAANLRDAGAELHIIGKDQVTSDLPEHRHLKGKPFDGKLTVDQRTRGLGGRLTSCGEENLLRLPGDRYKGRDICLHEFAHNLRFHGLPPEVRRRFDAQYRRSLAEGLWKTTYAGSNPDEFFAELTMWYFGTRGDFGKLDPKPEPGPAWLRAYDPEAFALLDDLYSGRIGIARPHFDRLEPKPADREGEVKSLPDGKPTTILLVNETPREVRVYWLDNDGKRRPYGTISPRGRDSHETFAGHAWLLADEDGRGLAIFVAGPTSGRGELAGDRAD